MKPILPVTQYSFEVVRHTVQKTTGKKLSENMGSLVLTEEQLIAVAMMAEGATRGEIDDALELNNGQSGRLLETARERMIDFTDLAYTGQYTLAAACKSASQRHPDAVKFPFVKGAPTQEALTKAAHQLSLAFKNPSAASYIGTKGNLEVFQLALKGVAADSIRRQITSGNVNSIETTCKNIGITRKESTLGRLASLLGMAPDYSVTLLSVIRPADAAVYTFADPVKPKGFDAKEFAARGPKTLDFSSCGRSGCAGNSGFMPYGLRG